LCLTSCSHSLPCAQGKLPHAARIPRALQKKKKLYCHIHYVHLGGIEYYYYGLVAACTPVPDGRYGYLLLYSATIPAYGAFAVHYTACYCVLLPFAILRCVPLFTPLPLYWLRKAWPFTPPAFTAHFGDRLHTTHEFRPPDYLNCYSGDVSPPIPPLDPHCCTPLRGTRTDACWCLTRFDPPIDLRCC